MYYLINIEVCQRGDLVISRTKLSINVEDLDIPVLLFKLKNGKAKILEGNKKTSEFDIERVQNAINEYYDSYDNIKSESIKYESNRHYYDIKIHEMENCYAAIFLEKTDRRILEYRLKKTQKIAKLGDWSHDLINDIEFWSKEIYDILELDPRYNQASVDLFLRFVHPDDKERVDMINENSFQNRKEYEIEFRIVTERGNEKWVFTHGTKEFNDEGVMVNIFGTMQDITEYKELENAFKKEREKAELASSSKSRFLANMSHEIRTPLNGIIGMTNVLRHEIDDVDLRIYLDNIKYSSDYLKHVIGEVLDFSKIESNKIVMENKNFDLEIMLSNIEQILTQKCKNKNLRFEINKDENLPKYFIGDYIRLQQVLLNLLGNAVKFTQVGSVTLNIRILEGHDSKIKLLFEVEDTGIGISKEKQKIIFDAYEQINSAEEYGGTGLGLPIAKNLLESMNSDLKLQSSLGRGSRFYFELELEKTEELLNESLDDLGNYDIDQGYELRVLVAEDDAINRMYVEKLLGDYLKHRVITSKDGQEAFEKYKKYGADVVLMDSRMPVKNGREAIRDIRDYESSQEIEHALIVAMSADASKETVDELNSCGADFFVTKPLNEGQIIKVLNKIKDQLKKTRKVKFMDPEKLVFEYIDLDGINQSRNLMGNSKMSVIINFAIEEYESVVKKIENCQFERNFDEDTLQNLHKIKGTIGYFSAVKIAKILPEIEEIFSNEYNRSEEHKIKDFILQFESFIDELKHYGDFLNK